VGVYQSVARAYRRGGLPAVANGVRARLEVRPTPLPLDAAATARIRKSLDRRSPAGAPPPEFPDSAEMQALWPAFELMVRLLARPNRGDPYFDPARLRRLRAEGRRIQTNLLELWLFLRWAPATILEIGTRTGLSLASKLAYLPAGHRATVVCVDPFLEQGSPGLVRSNLRRLAAPVDDIHFLIGDSRAAVPALADAFPDLRLDYALVDGSHDPEIAYADLCHVLPLVAPGGIVVFDDAGPTAPGVQGHDLIDVWRRAFEGQEDEWCLRHYAEPDGFCVARRRADGEGRHAEPEPVGASRSSPGG